MPKSSIAVKNALVYFILLVGTSIILGYSIYKVSSNKILENATRTLNHNNESVVAQFSMFLKDIQRDLTFISKNPFLYQFITDPKNEGLKSKLSDEFLALLSTNKHYLQLRLIGAHDEGREIIRAEKFEDRTRLVDTEHLQKKGDRDYFIETIPLPQDSIYYSEINLNQEYGKITVPMVPTVRMATPILINGKPYGIVIINIDLTYVFDELKKIAGSQFNLTLFNDDGYYLIHSDSSQLFGFEFNKPPAIDLLNPENKMQSASTPEDDKLYSIIQYSYPRPSYHLFFSLSADKEMLLSVFNQWKSDILWLTMFLTFLSLLIAIWWTQRQIKVFKSITQTIVNFGKNPENINLQIHRDDEIGELSNSFQEMANKIKLNLTELEIAKTEAIDANKAKQEFLENMSHEIRNPLQSILGMTGMLSQNNPRQDQQVFIDTLRFSSENLLTLVNDILDYRKLIRGQIELKFQDTGISEYLDNIIKSHLFDAVNKKLKLRLQMDPALSNKLFYTDTVRLSQILHNLISNAIRNSASQTEVILKVNKVNENEISFSIVDQGYGISEENIRNILSLQPVNNDAKQFQNVGLGLPIVINLLKLFGSNLQIESQPGKGSAFSFTLQSKIKTASDKPMLKNESVYDLNAYLLKVACIEDDIQNSFYYQQLFKRIGINCELYHDPSEFISTNPANYDLILTDYNFSENNLVPHFRNLKKALSDTGIFILISATDEFSNSLSSEKDEFDAFFTKPVSAENLLNELAMLVFNKHFEAPLLKNLFINYDYQKDKVHQALALVIGEWKEMFERLNTAILKKDIDLFDKVYHKLINTMRTFELGSLQRLLDETRLKLNSESSDPEILSHAIALPGMMYLKIFEKELEEA
jgi:signal transduction histidine kinase/CheY-like chemotaxis protein